MDFRNGVRFLVTGADCKTQMRHNYFPVTTGPSPGYFLIANGNEEGKLYVCKGLHHFVMYPPKGKTKMADILKMDPVFLPHFRVFAGHGYLQHAGAEYVVSHNMNYHIYIHPDDVNLQDGIVFAYGWSLYVATVREGTHYIADTDAH